MRDDLGREREVSKGLEGRVQFSQVPTTCQALIFTSLPKPHHFGRLLLSPTLLCDYAHLADEKNQGLDKLNDLPKVTQCVVVEQGFKARPPVTPKSIFSLPPTI